jgi:assimilatory nitrate reductase catalytic subunit
MKRYKIASDALVRIKTRRGHIVLPAMADENLKPGHAWLPMHWGSGFMAGHGVNALSNNVCDPVSHQPELKHSAAAVEALKYGWHATAWIQGSIPVLRQRFAKWLAAFPYAVLMPTAVGGEGLRLRLASPEKPDAPVLEELVGDLALDDADLTFDDPARGVIRRILRCDGQVAAYLLAGDTRAQEALLQWADSNVTPENIGQVLMGRAPGVARACNVCTCESVSDQAIHTAIDAGYPLEQLKTELKSGTACGSCLPQIKRMIQRRNAKPELQT